MIYKLAPCVIVVTVLLALAKPAISADTAPPASEMGLRVHPDNPKYFLFRGKPTVFLTATEHYGSVLNRPFDFEKYLDDLVDKKMNHTRTFLLFRELASAGNPASPCKPKPADYIAPWPRTGPGKALDGEPTFDLDQWNPEYFDRLHKFLDSASRHNVVVELTLLSNSYSPDVWALNPLRAENNKQGVGKIEWQEYLSVKSKDVQARQLAHVRKIVQETAKYDNIYYEICNEPGGGIPGHTMPAEVDEWEKSIADAVRDEMKKAGANHLIFGSQAFTYVVGAVQPLEETFTGEVFDAVNVHPLPDVTLGGITYQMGNYMSKELRLADLRGFGLTAWKYPKAVVWDEDNAASMFRDETGWTIHRKRAWLAMLSGANYDMIDFSIQVGAESGTPESTKALRTWFKHLSEFINSTDFVHASLVPTWIGKTPDHVLAATGSVEGKDYVAYLADQREVKDPDAGKEISGVIDVMLPLGTYHVRFYSPVEGIYAEGPTLEGGATRQLALPAFRQDLVVRAQPVR